MPFPKFREYSDPPVKSPFLSPIQDDPFYPHAFNDDHKTSINKVKQSNLPLITMFGAEEHKIIINKKHVLEIVHSDITKERVDCIINCTNPYMSHWDLYNNPNDVYKAGGKSILRESEEWIDYHKHLENIGDIGVTSGGRMPCKFIIHILTDLYVPYNHPDQVYKLKLCVNSILNRIIDAKSLLNVKSVSIPCIASGVNGFPKDKCS